MDNNKKFRVNDLRVGTLGVVSYISSQEVYWSKKKVMPYIVFETITDDKIKGVKKGRDVFSDNSYYFFNKAEERDKVFKESNNKCAIANNVPLNMVKNENFIESWELKKIVCILNIDYAMFKTEDDLLIRLKDGFNKLDLLDDYERENIIDMLVYLTEEYIKIITYPSEEFRNIYEDLSLQILEVLDEINKLVNKESKKRTKKK